MRKVNKKKNNGRKIIATFSCDFMKTEYMKTEGSRV